MTMASDGESKGGDGASYARIAVGGRIDQNKRKKLNILDIFLERKDESINFNLSKDELSKLLFKKMKIDQQIVIKIDTSAFKKIQVEIKSNVNAEIFCDLPTFEIRDGLRTKFYRPRHKKETLVTISWLDLETPD